MKTVVRLLYLAGVAGAFVLFGHPGNAQNPPPLKPPADGPLSNAPPPSLPLTTDSVPGIPKGGVPLSGVSTGGIPLIDPAPPENRKGDAAATLVVYNSNDPESGELAQFYAEKRAIPKDRVLGLPCTRSEEVGRDEFDLLIATPLRKAFSANHWWDVRESSDSLSSTVTMNRIRFVVLMRGMPLKILAATNYAGDKPSGPPAISSHNEASVDSELSVLGVGAHPISGVLNNPYFRSYSRIEDAKQPQLMLVCRLDGPSNAVVRRMITDSIAAEKIGLKGLAYVDARGITEAGYEQGDQWLFSLANDARRQGIPVLLDQGPGLYPDSYPMRHAAFYFGWYAENVSGPFLQPDFHFEPGAIAVHIHSFSAATLQDPKRNWCAPLLAAGAAATLGNVYEPYLDLTPHLDIFFERLRSGFTFAESAYMSERVLSWVSTFIGDPLYRPFPSLPGQRIGESADEWAAYREGAIKWFADRATGENQLRQAGRNLKSGLIFEGLALLELTVNGQAEALEAFAQARKLYKNADDILRVSIHEVGLLEGMKRQSEGLALARKQIETFPKARAIEVLRMLEPAASPGKTR